MHERRYASTGDYANFTGSEAPPELDRRLLVAASRRVDRFLIGATYAVDEHGMPTHPDVKAALRDATCAQAEAWVLSGDLSGAGQGPEWGSVSIGDVSLGRGGGRTSTSGPVLADKAVDVLLVCGALNIQPWVRG